MILFLKRSNSSSQNQFGLWILSLYLFPPRHLLNVHLKEFLKRKILLFHFLWLLFLLLFNLLFLLADSSSSLIFLTQFISKISNLIVWVDTTLVLHFFLHFFVLCFLEFLNDLLVLWHKNLKNLSSIEGSSITFDASPNLLFNYESAELFKVLSGQILLVSNILWVDFNLLLLIWEFTPSIKLCRKNKERLYCIDGSSRGVCNKCSKLLYDLSLEALVWCDLIRASLKNVIKNSLVGLCSFLLIDGESSEQN